MSLQVIQRVVVTDETRPRRNLDVACGEAIAARLGVAVAEGDICLPPMTETLWEEVRAVSMANGVPFLLGN